VSIAVPVPDTTAPGAPSGLSAEVGAGGVTLRWLSATDNVGVTNYEVLRNTAPLATVGAVTTYADTTTAPGTSYSYQVRARDAAGNLSAPSSVVKVTTAARGSTTTAPTVLGLVLKPQASASRPSATSGTGSTSAGPVTTALTGGSTGLLTRTGILAVGAGAALLIAGAGSRYEPRHRRRPKRSRSGAA
jgi:hypothetical protein